ncbi:MAG: acyl-CoA dehydrogenase [Naasia sp.]|nr:acyl-CoA dehydrogenase [Naasia sp.]
MTPPVTDPPDTDALRAEARAFADSIYDGYLERALSQDFFWDIYREAAGRGYLGMRVARERGGCGASAVEAGVVLEEVARGDFNLGFCLFGAYSANRIIAEAGSDEVRERWLLPTLAGETAIGFALTELVAGSDSRNIGTRATRIEGGWRLHGHKTSSGFATFAGASIVFARTSDDPRNGITGFLVPLDSDGVRRERIPNAGFRPTGRGKLALDGVLVPDANVVGEVGRGFATVTGSFDVGRAMIALLAVGGAQRAIDMTIEFASTRETFGAPLSERQGITFPIAEHATRLEAAKQLAYHVLSSADEGRPTTKTAAMSKWFATESATNAARDMIVAHGHRGYSDELPLMQLMRDLQGLEIAEGPTQIQKMIITRELFGRSSGGRARA